LVAIFRLMFKIILNSDDKGVPIGIKIGFKKNVVKKGNKSLINSSF